MLISLTMKYVPLEIFLLSSSKVKLKWTTKHGAVQASPGQFTAQSRSFHFITTLLLTNRMRMNDPSTSKSTSPWCWCQQLGSPQEYWPGPWSRLSSEGGFSLTPFSWLLWTAEAFQTHWMGQARKDHTGSSAPASAVLSQSSVQITKRLQDFSTERCSTAFTRKSRWVLRIPVQKKFKLKPSFQTVKHLHCLLEWTVQVTKWDC